MSLRNPGRPTDSHLDSTDDIDIIGLEKYQTLANENVRKTEPIKRSGRGFDDEFRRKGNKHPSKRR